MLESCYHCVWATSWFDSNYPHSPDDWGFECGLVEVGSQHPVSHVHDAYLQEEDDVAEYGLATDFDNGEDGCERYAEMCPGYKPKLIKSACHSCGKEIEVNEATWKYWGTHPDMGDPYPVCSHDCLVVDRSKQIQQQSMMTAIEHSYYHDTQYPRVPCPCCSNEMILASYNWKHWAADWANLVAHPVCSDSCASKLSQRFHVAAMSEAIEKSLLAHSIRERNR